LAASQNASVSVVAIVFTSEAVIVKQPVSVAALNASASIFTSVISLVERIKPALQIFDLLLLTAQRDQKLVFLLAQPFSSKFDRASDGR
jgi:hypothetical protein